MFKLLDLIILLSSPVILLILVSLLYLAWLYEKYLSFILIVIICLCFLVILIRSIARNSKRKLRFYNINRKSQKKIEYIKSSPPWSVDKFFYETFELFNDHNTSKEIKVSIFSTGKIGKVIFWLSVFRQLIFMLFIIIFLWSLENIEDYFAFSSLIVTILFVALLEFFTNTLNVFLYWRNTYANGKDILINKEEIEMKQNMIIEKLEEIKDKESEIIKKLEMMQSKEKELAEKLEESISKIMC